MRLYILDKEFEINNDRNAFIQIANIVEDVTKGTEYKFGHMIIDGEIIYNYQEYIEDNIKKIEEIKIATRTMKELVKEILISINEYVSRAIPEINKLSSEFYRETSEESWTKLSQLFEGVNFMVESFKSIEDVGNLNDIISDYEIWNEYVKEIYSLNEVITKIKILMESNDVTSIGDILSHEIVTIFENMKEKLEKLIS
ncbi:hypothetical protein CLPU_2c00930 [Gottschalkia purinilytica]|uniref:Uncharacterized protein n=1 Tax=Gottschalkia purinilytica TaxID=1503 RepID=A0A0L0WDT6_GOTPU|nr:hypothetical protein [Gottschalkia purinilytica]KNF09642.1 hypothetical protein CLPU_2c00930 [Gottschalkia purinilytica]